MWVNQWKLIRTAIPFNLKGKLYSNNNFILDLSWFWKEIENILKQVIEESLFKELFQSVGKVMDNQEE